METDISGTNRDSYYFTEDFDPSQFIIYDWQDLEQFAENFYKDEYQIDGVTAVVKTGQGVSDDGKMFTFTLQFPAVIHNLQKVDYKAPACTVEGNEEYWYCKNCGKYFSDAEGENEITSESTVIPATGHNWSEPEWNWSDDGKTCTVTFTCANDETHKESPNVTVTSAVKTLATCTENGVTTYTATVEFNGQTYTDTKDVADIPAIGHSYGEPVWSWSEDGTSCTVTFTCANDETHKESPEVTVTSEVKTPATCTETGVTTYTATVEFNGQTYTDTKDVADIPTTGHSYGAPVWSWSEDGKTCTVTFTCANDETHKESAEVTVTSEVKTHATCTETGVTTYTATVEFNGQTYTDMKEVADIPATGHSYEDGKCTVCGAADPDYKPTESGNENSDSSETGETTSPETGDNSNMMLWIAVMLAAGTALTGTILYSRKRKYSK